jgi:unsaturated chondroitin disaccharide hydrolase
MMCSYGQAYRITGSRRWLGRLFESAEKLSKRFNPTVGAIKSWDFVRKDWQYPVIIDNMMNLELLTRASKLFRNDALRDVAVSHARTTARNAFRPDFTSCHLVDYDPSTGAVRSKQTVQGYSDASAWARGQAWAFYGYTMMYRETGLEEFLAQACDIARMLLSRLPSDGIPYWDFDNPAIPAALKDASAGAIMASAFAELSGLAKDPALAQSCLEMARTQVRTLSTIEYLAPAGQNCGFLLKHSVGNLPEKSEVDVALTYADYYYLEAVSRLAAETI